MRAKLIKASILVLVGFSGLFVIKKIEQRSQDKPVEAQQKKPIPTVRAIPLQKEEIPIYYTANGYTESKVSATIKPEVSGRVVKISVEEGDFVKAGQTLAVIEPQKQQYQLEFQFALINQLEATYQNKKSIYERRKQLYEKELISKEELENARTDMEVALSELNSAKASLKEYQRQERETVIRAPFDGFLDKRKVSVGDYVDSQREMFYILKLDPMYIVFSLPQQYLSKLKRGSQVEVDLDGVGGVKGVVDYISSSLDQNGLLTIKAVLPNRDSRIKEKMYGKVRIEVGRKSGYTVPEEAVQFMGDSSFIYVLSDGKGKRVPVEVVHQEKGKVYIVANIDQTDKVIVSNIMNLKDGMPVKVLPEVK